MLQSVRVGLRVMSGQYQQRAVVTPIFGLGMSGARSASMAACYTVKSFQTELSPREQSGQTSLRLVRKHCQGLTRLLKLRVILLSDN